MAISRLNPTTAGIPVKGFTLWLDAADTSTITLSGSAVTQWNDKSANAWQFVQATSGRRPTSGVTTINGLNVLDFDGGDILTSNGDINNWNFLHNGTKNTQFYVIKRNATNDGTNMIACTNAAGSSSVNGCQILINSSDFPTCSVQHSESGSSVVSLGNTVNKTLGTDTTLLTYAFQIGIPGIDRANKVKLFINNGSALGNSTNDSSPNLGNADAVLGIGDSAPGAGSGLKGKIAEVIMYAYELNATERNSVRDYLIAKWGIA